MKYDRAEAVRYMGAKKMIWGGCLADLAYCSAGTKCNPENAGRFCVPCR